MEGPPLKVVAEELSFLAGEQIILASGNSRIEKEALVDKSVQRVFSIGKNLLFQFPDNTVRVHFGMYGSYAVARAL